MINFYFGQNLINEWVEENPINEWIEENPIKVQVIGEIVKIATVAWCLNRLQKVILSESPPIFKQYNYYTTVIAPICEQVIFQHILRPSIHLIQNGWNWYQEKDPTFEEAKREVHIRVHLTAFFYAVLSSLKHFNRSNTIINFTWSYIGAASSGYLFEKYQTCSAGMLSQGINNILSNAISFTPSNYQVLYYIALLINRVGACILALNK